MVRYITPSVFAAVAGGLCAGLLNMTLPIFFQFLLSPAPQGQVLRAVLKWVILHLAVPLAGALLGMCVVVLLIRRRPS